jgi:hypothetical protein
MTEHIRRFIEWQQGQNQESFIKLFGSGEFKDELKGLDEKDREDAIVTAYSECVQRVGAFGYTSSAIVLHPKKNRTHFHLIYATRGRKGVEVFKEAEKKAMSEMEKARDEAQKRKREERTGQTEFRLFSGTVTQDPSEHFRSLRKRYMSRAREAVLALLQTKNQLAYDEAWSSAMTFPLTWESDLKYWIRDWELVGQMKITGMKKMQRVLNWERTISSFGRNQAHLLQKGSLVDPRMRFKTKAFCFLLTPSHLSLGREWPRLPFTARIERAHSYRARSASKKGTWPLPTSSPSSPAQQNNARRLSCRPKLVPSRNIRLVRGSHVRAD